MNKLIKFLKEFALLYDVIITILGIVLIISVLLAFQNPSNHYVVFAAFTAGGLINVFNGLKLLKDSKKKNMGMSSILFGIIIIFAGYVLIINNPAI